MENNANISGTSTRLSQRSLSRGQPRLPHKHHFSTGNKIICQENDEESRKLYVSTK